MAPVLPSGATVTIVRAARRPPRLGDVVLVRQPDGLRLHRLIWGPPLTLGLPWRTKGDRARSWDARTPREAVLGTVIACGGRDDFNRSRIWRTGRSLVLGLGAWAGAVLTRRGRA